MDDKTPNAQVFIMQLGGGMQKPIKEHFRADIDVDDLFDRLQYKIELSYKGLWKIQLRRPLDQNRSKFLLIQVLFVGFTLEYFYTRLHIQEAIFPSIGTMVDVTAAIDQVNLSLGMVRSSMVWDYQDQPLETGYYITSLAKDAVKTRGTFSMIPQYVEECQETQHLEALNPTLVVGSIAI
ncbi:hypothetical protein NE237_027000 [Protea cynaroides]|uniref:Uncharacterized protein n=1 Tax=Protea cynaroides TaxID=273540 RepID=A0A9Q0GPB3_9MAGN|nr:hypothetical protein NE237_027000 [Protea cynaroides]